MFVVTINQRDTREAGDQVDQLIAGLTAHSDLLSFERTVGDECQAVLENPGSAVEAALLALRPRRWNVGIGICSSVNITDGLIASRRAVVRAAETGRSDALRAGALPLRVVAAQPVPGEAPRAAPVTVLAEEAEAVLRLLGHIVAERTDAEWRVLDLLVPGVRGQQKFVAEALGITAQAVSKAIQRSRWMEELAARPGAARLLSLAAGSD
jgi:hypothetical protein